MSRKVVSSIWTLILWHIDHYWFFSVSIIYQNTYKMTFCFFYQNNILLYPKSSSIKIKWLFVSQRSEVHVSATLFASQPCRSVWGFVTSNFLSFVHFIDCHMDTQCAVNKHSIDWLIISEDGIKRLHFLSSLEKNWSVVLRQIPYFPLCKSTP